MGVGNDPADGWANAYAPRFHASHRTLFHGSGPTGFNRFRGAYPMSKVLEVDKNTRELFRVAITEDGYFAYRVENPKFALHGRSIAEVARKASCAFDVIRFVRG